MSPAARDPTAVVLTSDAHKAEDVDMESLGGPDTHGRRSGVVHVVTDSEAAALSAARHAVELLCDQGTFAPL